MHKYGPIKFIVVAFVFGNIFCRGAFAVGVDVREWMIRKKPTGYGLPIYLPRPNGRTSYLYQSCYILGLMPCTTNFMKFICSINKLVLHATRLKGICQTDESTGDHCYRSNYEQLTADPKC